MPITLPLDPDLFAFPTEDHRPLAGKLLQGGVIWITGLDK